MLLTMDRNARQQLTFPPFQIELVGRISSGEDRPDCPVCGGFLDLCQPDAEASGSQLIGACVHCERLSYVVGTGPMAVVLVLPSADEISARAFGQLASA